MSSLKTYPDGTPFTGVIGRTTEDSSPAWPTPSTARDGSPNVLIFVLDDVGYPGYNGILPFDKGMLVFLEYEFEPTGQADFAVGKGSPGIGKIHINQQLVGAIEMPHSVPVIFGTEGLTCGYDGGDRVASDEYSDKFTFTGVIKRVTVDLSGELIADSPVDLKIAMARQ